MSRTKSPSMLVYPINYCWLFFFVACLLIFLGQWAREVWRRLLAWREKMAVICCHTVRNVGFKIRPWFRSLLWKNLPKNWSHFDDVMMSINHDQSTVFLCYEVDFKTILSDVCSANCAAFFYKVVPQLAKLVLVAGLSFMDICGY